MLVKKKNPEWYPKENLDLKVGDTIEITDPRDLILRGDVVGLGVNGEELSAYELYGVIIADEKKEFEEYLKIKKQEALKKQLEEERAVLEKQLENTKEANPVSSTPAPAPVEAEVKEEKVEEPKTEEKVEEKTDGKTELDKAIERLNSGKKGSK